MTGAMRLMASFALAAAALAQTLDTEAAAWHVYAVRYATIADFPVSSLVAGAEASRRQSRDARS